MVSSPSLGTPLEVFIAKLFCNENLLVLHTERFTLAGLQGGGSSSQKDYFGETPLVFQVEQGQEDKTKSYQK